MSDAVPTEGCLYLAYNLVNIHSLVQSEICQQQLLHAVAMDLCAEIHGVQRLILTDFGDTLTFPLTPPSDQTCHLSNTLV